MGLADPTRTTKKKNNNREENGRVQGVNFGPLKQGKGVSYREHWRGELLSLPFFLTQSCQGRGTAFKATKKAVQCTYIGRDEIG